MSLKPETRGRVLGALAATLLASALAWRGCGTDSEPASPAPQQDAGLDTGNDLGEASDAASDADARLDAPAAEVEAGKDALPDGVPPGWEEYTGWSAECPLYVPGEGAEMPPPIEWEPCPEPVPQTLGCRRMKNTWNGIMGFYPNFALDTLTGKPLIQFTRAWPDGNQSVFYRLVVEADGIVRTALLQTNGSVKCQFFEESLADNRYAVSGLIQNSVSPDAGSEEGVVAGSIDERYPTTVLKLLRDPSVTSSWRISSDWIVQLKYVRKAWTWDLSTTLTVYDPAQDPDGLPAFVPVIRHKDVFLRVGDFGLCGIMSWNATEGLRPLLRWYGDSTRGAGNFGTDGVDMVWTYAQGSNACHIDLATSPEVWTAPYTLDPAEAQSKAKRVRSDVRGMSAHPFVVGFGYAARGSAFGSPPANNLFVVRLSDGVAWVLTGDPTGDAINWGPNVLGITQEEVFLTGSMKDSGTTIFRIRLDSLGPGTPPD